MLVEDNETAAVDEVVFSATIDVVKTHLSTQDIPEGDIPQLIRDINLCFLEIAESGEVPQVAKQPMIRELRQETPEKAPAPTPAPVEARAEKVDEVDQVSPTTFEQALANPDLVFTQPEAKQQTGMEVEDLERAFRTPTKAPAPPHPPRHTPKIAPEKSVSIEYIVCLEDGKRVKDLAKHLKSNHRMTPAAYRRKWKLPEEYPMIPPALLRRRGVTVEVDPETGDFLE